MKTSDDGLRRRDFILDLLRPQVGLADVYHLCDLRAGGLRGRGGRIELRRGLLTSERCSSVPIAICALAA